jgi:protein-L-isoaspartate O-methyltransferase
VAHPQGRRPAAIFYPFGHPTPYAYVPQAAPLLASGAIRLLVGDGRLGVAAHAPYDVIHVGAAADDDVPQALVEQLAKGGRLLCPGGGGSGGVVIGEGGNQRIS